MKLAALLILTLTGGITFATERSEKPKSESRELVLPDLSQAQKQLDQRGKVTMTASDGCEANTADKPWKKDMTCPAAQGSGSQVQVKDPSAFQQPRTYSPDQQTMTGSATYPINRGN